MTRYTDLTEQDLLQLLDEIEGTFGASSVHAVAFEGLMREVDGLKHELQRAQAERHE